MSKQRYEQIGVAMTCRSYEEYIQMFNLQESDLSRGMVLDIAAGGSSFTADAIGRGYEAIAVDPRYGSGIQAWVQEAAEEIETSTAKLAKLEEYFDWSYYGSLDNHRNGRRASLERFSAHINESVGTSRYVNGRLPDLPFQDDQFSLVLCSHFMFLYANQFGHEFHINSVLEMIRICRPGGQIRIYPLISLSWEPYSELDQLMETITANGGTPELLSSNLPFIPGSEQYLRILL